MHPHKLSFGSILIVDKHIAEVIPSSDVEVSLSMVDEFLSFVSGSMADEISVILNKKTEYSYEFDALIKLSASEKIGSIAVVSYDIVSTRASEYLRQRFNKSGKKIKIFQTRESALAWLRESNT